jgi:hypothetical protein
MSPKSEAKREYSYDVGCEDLATQFLSDYTHSTSDVANLAQTIQDAIEGWFHSSPHVIPK